MQTMKTALLRPMRIISVLHNGLTLMNVAVLLVLIFLAFSCKKEDKNGDGSVISCNFNGVPTQWIGDNTSVNVTQISGKGQFATINLASVNNIFSLSYTMYFSADISTSTPADSLIINKEYSYLVKGFSFTDSKYPNVFFSNVSDKITFTRVSNNTVDGTFETIVKGFNPLTATYIADTLSNGIFKNVKYSKSYSNN